MVRGGEGEPLPQGAVIFRLYRSSDGRATPEAFQLSSIDKLQVIPRLSTWAEPLCSLSQADEITRGKNSHAGYLKVDDVRKLRPDPEDVRMASLDVHWEQAFELDQSGQERPCSMPGAEGHCGISGLNQIGDGRSAKQKRKSMYRQLAELANARTSPILRVV
jgi:hypothetical protein